MPNRLILALAIGAATVTGCGKSEVAQRAPSVAHVKATQSDEEAATETLKQMLGAAKQGRWGTYVDAYYGEPHKFRSPADRDALVKRFEEKWGEQLLPALSLAVNLPVKIETDRAVFLEGNETIFVLHRNEADQWKFHL